jgi:hypothetical protein
VFKEIRTELLIIGDLVYYDGPPILNPQDWGRIILHNNGVVNRDDIGIVLLCDNFLKIANIYFQESDIEIPRLSYKYLIRIE